MTEASSRAINDDPFETPSEGDVHLSATVRITCISTLRAALTPSSPNTRAGRPLPSGISFPGHQAARDQPVADGVDGVDTGDDGRDWAGISTVMCQ